MIAYLLPTLFLLINGCSTTKHFDAVQNSENRVQPNIAGNKTFLEVETNVKTNEAIIVYLHNCYIKGAHGEFRKMMTAYLSNGTLGDLFNERPGFCLEALAVAVKYREKYVEQLLNLADVCERDPRNREIIQKFGQAWSAKKRDRFVDCMRLYLNNRDLKVISKRVGKDPVLKAIF